MKSLTTDSIQHWFTAESDSINHDRSSIYTKDDILNILKGLKENMLNDATEEEVSVQFSSDHIRDIVDGIVGEMECSSLDLINDYDLTINHREIELDSISFDSKTLVSIVRQALEDHLEEIEMEKQKAAFILTAAE